MQLILTRPSQRSALSFVLSTTDVLLYYNIKKVQLIISVFLAYNLNS